jgi:hypothetical protein
MFASETRLAFCRVFTADAIHNLTPAKTSRTCSPPVSTMSKLEAKVKRPAIWCCSNSIAYWFETTSSYYVVMKSFLDVSKRCQMIQGETFHLVKTFPWKGSDFPSIVEETWNESWFGRSQSSLFLTRITLQATTEPFSLDDEEMIYNFYKRRLMSKE